LSRSEIGRFAREGYVIVPEVVPEALLAAADAEIDQLVDRTAPDEGDGGPGPNLWFVPCGSAPACTRLFDRSAVDPLAAELVAPLSLVRSSPQVQVATTMPPYRLAPGGPHIDGHGPGQDPPHSFTMLAAIFLTDQSGPSMGNLWVWPGSHLAHRRLFAERGPRALLATGGHPTLLDPPPALPPPVEVTARRGDLMLAHFLLGHNKGPHTAPWVRRTVYLRLAVRGHAARWASTFVDPWLEYPPVRALLAAPDGS
jgi:hypothetical protein